ncbi:MAG: hypothetical protein IPK78_20965 [Rhodospirillales bacterium]|nr:hypothetical protein [Rhodospirillales bacterium]
MESEPADFVNGLLSPGGMGLTQKNRATLRQFDDLSNVDARRPLPSRIRLASGSARHCLGKDLPHEQHYDQAQ